MRRFENLAFQFGDLAKITAGFPTDQFGAHKADQLSRLIDKRHNVIINREVDPVVPRRHQLRLQLCQVS